MTHVLCVTGSYQLLDELKKYGDMDFPDIDLRTDSRLHVCGETLERHDLKTLTGRNWLNDKVIELFALVNAWIYYGQCST